MLEETQYRSSGQRRLTNIGRPEASMTDSRATNATSSDETTDNVSIDPGRSFPSPVFREIPVSSLLIGQQAASLQLAQLKAQLALSQLNNGVAVGCQVAKLTPPSPTAAAISLLNLLKIANTMSQPLCNPFASGKQSSIQGPHGLTADKDLPGTSESNFNFNFSYSASPANSGLIIPLHTTQSMNYGPEQSRAVPDSDLSRARGERTFPPEQNTHYLCSAKESTTNPMSSTSASKGHTLCDVERKKSSLDWLPKYTGSTTDNSSKLYSRPASSNSINSSGFSFNSSIGRKCNIQSVRRLVDGGKRAVPAETRQPRYTSEAATDILTRFGLKKEDLELLSLYPEDQLTPTNLPFILRQIRIQKTKRSMTTVESKPDTEPRPIRSLSGSLGSSAALHTHKVIDYGHTCKYFGGVVDDTARTNSISANRDGSGRMLSDSYEQRQEPLENHVSQGKVSAFSSSYGQSSSSSSYGSVLQPVAPSRNDVAKQLMIESNQTFDPILSSLYVPKKDKDRTTVPSGDSSKVRLEPKLDKTVVLPEDPKSTPLKKLGADSQSSYTLLHGMHPDRPGLVLISIGDAKNTMNQDKTQGSGSTTGERRTQENQEQKNPAVQTGKALRIPVISEGKPAPQRSVAGSQSTSSQPVQSLQKWPTPYPAKPPVVKDLPTPAVICITTTPKVIPHTFSLCHKECSHMTDTTLHPENCRDLQTLSPQWSGEQVFKKSATGEEAKPSSSTSVQNSQKPLKKSRSTSPYISKSSESRKLPHRYRYNYNPYFSSRTCSLHYDRHRSPSRRRNERRSSVRMSEERSSRESIRESRSMSRKTVERRSPRRRERRLSPERSTKRRKSSSVEKLMMEILKKSESNAQAVVSTLLTELTKIKSSSPSPSASSSSSSAAKKNETTTGSRKAGQQEDKDSDQKTTDHKKYLVPRSSKSETNKSIVIETEKVDELTDKSESTVSSQKSVIVEKTKESAEEKSQLDTRVQESENMSVGEPSQVPEVQVAEVNVETISCLQEPKIQAENFVVGETCANVSPIREIITKAKINTETRSSEKSKMPTETVVSVGNETKEKATNAASKSESCQPENHPAVETSQTKELDPDKVDESRNTTEAEQNKLSNINFENSSSQKPRLREENLASAGENTAEPKDEIFKSTLSENPPDKETSESEESDTKVVVITEDRDNVFEEQTTTDKHINEETAVNDVKTEEIDTATKSVEETGKPGLTNVPVTQANETSSPEQAVENLIPADSINMNSINSQKLTSEDLPDAKILDTKVQQSAVVPQNSGNVLVPELDCGAESTEIHADTKRTEDTALVVDGQTGAEVAEPMEDGGSDEGDDDKPTKPDTAPDTSRESQPPTCSGESRADLSAHKPPTVPLQTTEAEPENQNPQTDTKTPETPVKASSQDLQPESTAPGLETKMEASEPSSTAEDSSSKLSLYLSLKDLKENLQNHDDVTTNRDISGIQPHVQTSFHVAAEPEIPDESRSCGNVQRELNPRSAGDTAETEDSQKLVDTFKTNDDVNTVPAALLPELLHIDNDAFMAIKAAVCQYRIAKGTRTQTRVSNKESTEVTEKMDEKPVVSTSERSVRRRSARGKRDDLTEVSKELEYEKTLYTVIDYVEDETAAKEPTDMTRYYRGRRERRSWTDVWTDKTKMDTLTRRSHASARKTPKNKGEPPKAGRPTRMSCESLDFVENVHPTRKGRRGRPKKDMNINKEDTATQKKVDDEEEEEEEVLYQIIDSVEDEKVNVHPSTEKSTFAKETETSENDEKLKKESASLRMTKEVSTRGSKEEVHVCSKEDKSATSSTSESTTGEDAEETARSDAHKDHNGAAKRKNDFDGPEVKRSRQVHRVAAANFKMPPFHLSGVFGPEFVVPKSGFFCNVCRLFFLKNVGATSHCSTRQHYDNLQKHYEELQRKLSTHQTPKCQGSSSG